MAEPDKSLSKVLTKTGEVTLTYGELPHPKDLLSITLSDAISNAIVPETRVRIYRFNAEQDRYVWFTDTWTGQDGKVDVQLAGLLNGEKYKLTTRIFNDRDSATDEISSGAIINFAVGDTKIHLIDFVSQQPITASRVTIRKKTDVSSDFFTYIYPDDKGVIQLDLPGLAAKEAQYYVSINPPSMPDQAVNFLIDSAGEMTLIAGEEIPTMPVEPTPIVVPSGSPTTTPIPPSVPEVPEPTPNPDAEVYFKTVYPAIVSAPAATTLGTTSLQQVWPVWLSGDAISSGIPFAFGELQSENNVKLLDNNNQVEAQFKRLASWPDGSVKSLLVITQPTPGNIHQYQLDYGVNVTNAENSGVTVTQQEQQVIVDTGKVQLILSKQGKPFTSIHLDKNLNGSYESDELQLSQGDIFLVNAANGQEYLASYDQADISIEQAGALKTVVKLTGELKNEAGEALTQFIVRITALKGASSLDWEYSLVDNRHSNVYDKSTLLALSVTEYGLRWQQHSNIKQVTAGIDGQSVEQILKEESYLHQAGEFKYDNGSFLGNDLFTSGISAGEKADGWFALQAETSQTSVFVKDFWQNYPNEISVTKNRLTVSLHPARFIGQPDLSYPAHVGTQYTRPNTFYFPRSGEAKTSQFKLHFTETKLSNAQLAAVNNSYQRKGLNLLAQQSRYLTSGVFGKLTSADQEAAIGYDAWLKKSVLDYSWKENKSAQPMGWRDYGDRLRSGWANVIDGVRIPSFYNDTHVGSNGFFKQYLRTGDVTWFDVAERATRHFMDIDVNHGSRSGYWSTGGAQPAGEIHAFSHDMIDHHARNMHLGHAHISGLTDYYLLTGDMRSREVIEEIGQWWKFMLNSKFTLPFNAGGYREAERDYGWPLYVMNEYVRVSNDTEYHRRVSAQLVHHVMQWFNTPLAHRVRGVEVGINDASQGSGYWTMTKMDNHGMTDSNGANPWMAGALMSSLLQFYEYDKMVGSSINHDEFMDMQLQALNYLVKYAYNHQDKHFGYSEIIQSYGGAGFQLLYAMVYMSQEYDTRLAQGKLANPEWYDTQPQWAEIQQRIIDKLNNSRPGANSQSYGFYGYEVPWPLDIWELIEKK